jgi:hypothetical protein
MKFQEVQRFTQWWLWLILLGIAAVAVYGIYKQLILGEPFGDNPMSNPGLIAFSVLIFGTIAFFIFINLKTEIDDKEIRIEFVPFAKKTVHWKDVKKAEIVNYGFVGYGVRVSSKYGTVYNTKGNRGLAIQLNNGEKYLIGTQKGEELKNLIKRIKLTI